MIDAERLWFQINLHAVEGMLVVFQSLEHMINYSLIEYGTIQMCCSSLQTIQHLSLCFTLSNLILKHLMNHVCSTLKLFLIATHSQHHFACEM